MTQQRPRPRAIQGANLWAIREDDLRLTRADLAKKLDISPAYLWKIENDQAQPSPTVRGRIVDALAALTGTPRGAILDRLTDPDRALAA